jgi:hypothetical protein
MIEYLIQAEADVAKNELRARNRRDQVKSRNLQTEEQKNYYREQNKNRHKLIKERETPEQRIKRINHAKELRKLALARETPEQRQRRLEKVQRNRSLKNKNSVNNDVSKSKVGYTRLSKDDTVNILKNASISNYAVTDFIKLNFFPSNNSNDKTNMCLDFSTLSHSGNYDGKDDKDNVSDNDDSKCLADVLLSISNKKARIE